GALLAADSWQRAWRPSLRIAFDEIVQTARAEAVAEGRAVPESSESDEAFATVTGILRNDASPGASGISLSIDAEGIAGLPSCRSGAFRFCPVSGGLLATVV